MQVSKYFKPTLTKLQKFSKAMVSFNMHKSEVHFCNLIVKNWSALSYDSSMCNTYLF